MTRRLPDLRRSRAQTQCVRQILVASLGVALGVGGCRSDRISGSETTACSPEASITEFAFSVHPVDAQTGARLSATIVASDGDYRETLLPGPGGLLGNAPDGYYGVPNRSGTYRLTASAAGYAVWSRDSIRVRRDANCRLETVSLTIPLLPSAP